jgi:hypothetical protein
VRPTRSDAICVIRPDHWLSRYPWPQRCVHNPGGEFVGIEFQTLLQDCCIRDECTSAKNPQSNAVCKRMHQTVGNVLRALLFNEPPQNIEDAKEFVDEALSIAKHAIRAGIHSTLGSSPGSLIFNRDMFLNIPLIANWLQSLRKENISSMRTSCEKIRRGDGMITFLNMLQGDYTSYSTRVFLARLTRSDGIRVRRPDHQGWISKETR